MSIDNFSQPELEPSSSQTQENPQPPDAAQSTVLAPVQVVDHALVSYVDETMGAITENQKTILNSQAANRELMGVLIQDNFNLKDENTRLRQRVLELEQGMAHIQRQEAQNREVLRQELEQKLAIVQQLAFDAKQPTPQPTGCLAFFLNGGVPAPPQPRPIPASNPPDSASEANKMPPSEARPISGPHTPQSGHHPRPKFPPE